MNFQPKRMFGQNFLIDRNIAAKIVRLAGLTENDIVWEIGPGRGILTTELLKIGCRLICYEIDRDLIPGLRERFGERITLITEDVLRADWREVYSETEGQRVKIVANIPYNITSPLLYKITENIGYFEKICIMVQREVAERITASPGIKSYGVMSIRIQHSFQVKKLFSVSRHLFRPQPNVDSEVIELIPRSDRVEPEDPILYWQIIEASFQSRRKTLKNNLGNILSSSELERVSKLTSNRSVEELTSLGIRLDKPLNFDLGSRGESLDEKDFSNLYRIIRAIRQSRE
jgi:16S rRNA (adenine1518-N6/adenine1519-N6)-dimethyltransferase